MMLFLDRHISLFQQLLLSVWTLVTLHSNVVFWVVPCSV